MAARSALEEGAVKASKIGPAATDVARPLEALGVAFTLEFVGWIRQGPGTWGGIEGAFAGWRWPGWRGGLGGWCGWAFLFPGANAILVCRDAWSRGQLEIMASSTCSIDSCD